MHQINPADAQRVDDRTEWPARRATFASCSGDCSQGRRPCITPDACRLADDEPGISPSWEPWTWLGLAKFTAPAWIAIAIVAAMLAVHYWPR